MRLFPAHAAVLLLWAMTAQAQIQTVGGKDYGLAASSVMWLPRSGALFLNPAELGRVHQSEFLLSTERFRNMASMSGTFAIPFIGTFAGGVANEDSLTRYSAGFGRLIGSYHTIGGSVSILAPIQDGFRFSFGGAFHLPFSEQNSGIHAGLSFENMPKPVIVNAGAAYWILPDIIRVQAALRSRIRQGLLLGTEVLMTNSLSAVAGSRAFQTIAGGLSYSSSTFAADLVGSADGVSFSLKVILGESAEDLRSVAYEDGYNLFSEKRFSDAQQKFLTALEYDEYDDDSRSMAQEARYYADSVETSGLQQAKTLEEKRDYSAAMTAYMSVLRANPANKEAEDRIAEIRQQTSLYVAQLISSGDSLKDRSEITKARRNYELALKYDPGNDDASSRIDELNNLSKENVKAILSRAQSLLNRNQLDNAKTEYERVLNLEPRNSRARAGLNAIEAKRQDEQFDLAKAAFREGKYFEALRMFIELSKHNEKNKEIQSFIELTRAKLQPEVEKLFKMGLSLYAKEYYEDAINTWDKALLIQPRHAGLLEYRKRAEEKKKAMEQLQ
jgi:tetratricopeptide (TPR) repeat protein